MYFFDKDLDSIDNDLSDLVRPLERLTKQLLDQAVTRDIRAKVKKISWLMKSEENFAIEFKRNMANDT